MSFRLPILRPAYAALLLSSTILTPASAQQEAATVLPTINVEGRSEGGFLGTPTQAGSLVGLTPRETPATVSVITQRDMQERGLRTFVETINSVPGAMSGNLPGEPGVISMRGFSRAATGYSIDGVRAPDPLIVARDYDTFNFDRIEILKGPASVTGGTGALAGAVNIVTKQARIGERAIEALLSYGSFNAIRAGIDVNTPLGENAAVRTTFSYSQSDGYVNDTASRKVGLTTSGVFTPTERLTLTASFAYFHDSFRTAYQGIPLIPGSLARNPSDLVSAPGGLVVDRALARQNYNVENGLMRSDSAWLRGGLAYRISENWTFRNDLSLYVASRYWGGSEDYTYNKATGLLDRSTTIITHDHRFWSNRSSLSFDGHIGSLRNRFSVGAEYIDTIFGTNRRFGTTTSVDPFNPIRGLLPEDTAANYATRQNFYSQLRTFALFAENAVNITPDWLVVAGIRRETMALDRQIDNLNTGVMTRFGRTYEDLSWRFGTVYTILPGTVLFAQYNRAAVPITSLLLSNVANGAFDLSTGRSVEAGIKSTFWGNRAVATASIYQIDQDNILTRDPVTPSLTIQGGSQRSRGVELDLTVAVTDQWRVGANAAFIDARYTSLRNASGDLTGNRPINVPARMFTVWTSYRFDQVPLTIGASFRHVGSFYTDTANTIEVKGHALVDAWLAYDVGQGTLRLRGRNLTNAFYADWSGYSATQVYIGAPRSVDLSYTVKF